MAQAPWHTKDGAADLLVDMAAGLDAQYPGRAVLAVGHSPSWLVYALGALRQERGEEARTAFVPHSGRLHDVHRDDAYAAPDDKLTIRYEASTLLDSTPGAVSDYFNFLSRHRLDPQHMQNTHGAKGAPVLVDFSRKGEGYATFLRLYNDLATQQGVKGVADGGFAAHTYKMKFDTPAVTLNVAPLHGRDGDAIDVPCAVTSGPAGEFMNVMAGGRGYDTRQREENRFMPYYAVSDTYRKDGYAASYPPPASGLHSARPLPAQIREIKALIKSAAALHHRHPEICKDRAQQAAEAMAYPDMTRPRGQTWTFVARGYHG